MLSCHPAEPTSELLLTAAGESPTAGTPVPSQAKAAASAPRAGTAPNPDRGSVWKGAP